MKNKWITRIVALLCVATLICALIFTSNLLKPKRFDYGSTWGQFLKEDKDSIDILFLGTSKTYCDIIPAVIWQKTGITSYVMAGPSQTIPLTYYYVDEVFKTQHPKVVFVEVTGLIYRHLNEYQLVNIGYMPFGMNKINAALNEADKSDAIGSIFPLYAYHSRWNELDKSDITVALKGYSKDNLAGYTYLDTSNPISEDVEWGLSYDESDFDRNFEYLKKIVEVCKENNAEIVLYMSPSKTILKDNFQQRIDSSINGLEGVYYYNFNDNYDEMNIDDAVDYYDFMHFNVYGAEKLSDWLGNWITANLTISASTDCDKTLWDSRVEAFYNHN